MCTAITYQTKDFYFGRTLDYDISYGNEITITPRGYCFAFRDAKTLRNHYAIIGMAYVAENYPLYYDAVNEKGLGMAGLNFVGSAPCLPSLDNRRTRRLHHGRIDGSGTEYLRQSSRNPDKQSAIP